MSVLEKLQEFFQDLRGEGIPITAGQMEDCLQALLIIDWSAENYFFTSLESTLVKEYPHLPVFREVYQKYFHPGEIIERPKWVAPVYRDVGIIEDVAGYMADALPIYGMQSVRGGLSQSARNPLDQSFSLADLDDVRKMESFFPLIANRLAARMIKKNRRRSDSIINYRSTLRKSMASGGIPMDLVTQVRLREKPIIIAICDISGSVMTYSCFALALLASMQRFFRQLRTFAFIEQIEEITDLLNVGNPLELRTTVLQNARGVIGSRGYTNYGASFKAFSERYADILSHKTTVLIFGDARNNWFNDETKALEFISEKAKKVYWFNPEPQSAWNRGDSRMNIYLQYCDKYFSCPNLSQMEKAFGHL